MLAGEPPFTGPTPQAMVARRLTEPPPSLRSLRESCPTGSIRRWPGRWPGHRRTASPPRRVRRRARGRPNGRTTATPREPAARAAARPFGKRRSPSPSASAFCWVWACCSAGCASMAPRRRRGPAPSARRASVREPGRLERRVLRRRHHRRGAGKAGLAVGAQGDRQQQARASTGAAGRARSRSPRSWVCPTCCWGRSAGEAAGGREPGAGEPGAGAGGRGKRADH